MFLCIMCHLFLIGCVLQAELLHLSRTNFSEAYQLLVHLKVARLFVESVLRYGLPANYVGLAIKVGTASVRPPSYPNWNR